MRLGVPASSDCTNPLPSRPHKDQVGRRLSPLCWHHHQRSLAVLKVLGGGADRAKGIVTRRPTVRGRQSPAAKSFILGSSAWHEAGRERFLRKGVDVGTARC